MVWHPSANARRPLKKQTFPAFLGVLRRGVLSRSQGPGRMPTKSTSYLERHHDRWRVVVKVPAAVREYIGKAHLKEPLKTSNLATANLLKAEVVARLKHRIEEAMILVSEAPEYAEARALRAAANRASTPPVAPQDGLVAYQQGRQVFWLQAGPAAPQLTALAPMITVTSPITPAKATPLKTHMEAFTADHGYQPKSLLEMERTLRRLGKWLSRKNHLQTIEAVTPELAVGFMRHLVHDLALSRKNAGKYVSFLRSYWKWLIDHGYLSPGPSPWSAPIPKPKATGRHADLEPDEGKRPYKAEELRKLLNGKPRDPALLDLIKLGALTGMRLEEIYRLRVRDVEDGFFLVRVGKTANARRKVPIHPDLEGLVKRLTEGREPKEYLVDPTAPVVEKTGIRSGAASKAFGYYRKSVGVDDRPNGKLKSNVDFHSLRRWFIMSARDALLNGATGYNNWTIAEVAGHETGLTDTLKMTLGVYAGASGDEALRACVAAVRLPNS